MGSVGPIRDAVCAGNSAAQELAVDCSTAEQDIAALQVFHFADHTSG